MASADDRFPALLGYIEGCSYSESLENETLQWWLGEYAREMAYSISAGAAETDASETDDSRGRRAIAPLVTAKWNQDAPYWDDAPQYGDRKAYTGCVAVSTSQIMRSHRWPQGNCFGKHSYEWEGETLTFDYDNYVINWDNLIDDYKQEHSEEQSREVARLMSAVGIGLNMQYSTTFSGAFGESVPETLRDFFGYDPGVRSLSRDYYATEKWEEMIYQELEAGRAVVYNGATTRGSGHSFVCDGYDGNGLFHINWGWGGMSDGYFLLSVLYPGEQGIGGSTSGYVSSQSAIVGIMPPQEGSKMPNPIIGKGTCAMVGRATKKGDVYTLRISGSTGFYNTTTRTAKGYFRAVVMKGAEIVKVVDEVGHPLHEIPGLALNCTASGVEEFSVELSTADFTPGDYLVIPVFRTDEGLNERIRFKDTEQQGIKMRRATSSLIFSGESVSWLPDYAISGFETAGNVEAGTELKIAFDVMNFRSGRLNEELGIYAYPKGEAFDWDSIVCLGTVPMEAASKGSAHIEGTIKAPASKGEYQLEARDRYSDYVCPVGVMSVTGESGVDTIPEDQDTLSEGMLYSLDGLPAGPVPARGIYVRINKGVRSKVIVK